MTYPQAVIIGVAIVTGALLISELSNADEPRQGNVAISSPTKSVAWVARGDGKVRVCYGRGSDMTLALKDFRPYPAICTEWQ
jgi:hypothetical protein